MFYLSALKRARKERADTLCKALHVGRDNTREYVAMCVNMEGTSSSKRRRKEVRQRKECYTRNTTHLFTIDSRSAMLHEMMDFRRYFSRTSAYSSFDKNRLWPLNLFSLVGTSITISEQYFRSNANCEEIFLFPERQKKLSLLDIVEA